MNKIVSLLGIAIGLFALSTQAHAAQKYSYRAKGNAASYSAYSSTECGYENVTVYVFEERSSGNQTVNDSVYVDYTSYDFCTGSYTFGYGALDGVAFDVRKLQSASLDGTGTMELVSCNYGEGGGGGMGGMGGVGGAGGMMAGAGGVGGASGMGGVGGMGGAGGGGGGEDPCTYSNAALAVSIDWVGTGDIYKDRYVQVSSTPSARYRYVSNGQSREATTTAAISIDGAPLTLTDGYGSLSYSSTATFEIIR